jgi:hypothetical protein
MSKNNVFKRYAFEDLVVEEGKDFPSKYVTITDSDGEEYDVEMYLVGCEDKDDNECECEND